MRTRSNLIWLVPVIVTVAAVVTLNAMLPTPDMAGTSWALTKIDGTPVDPSVRATLLFDRQGVQGSTSCNAFYASYTLIGTDFHTSNSAVTEAACRDELKGVQQAYLDVLWQGGSLTLKGDTLLIRGSSGRELTFRQGGGTH